MYIFFNLERLGLKGRGLKRGFSADFEACRLFVQTFRHADFLACRFFGMQTFLIECPCTTLPLKALYMYIYIL